MHNQDRVVDTVGDWQPVEDVLEHAKHLGAILVQTLTLKPVHSVDFLCLMVTSGQKEIVCWIKKTQGSVILVMSSYGGSDICETMWPNMK